MSKAASQTYGSTPLSLAVSIARGRRRGGPITDLSFIGFLTNHPVRLSADRSFPSRWAEIALVALACKLARAGGLAPTAQTSGAKYDAVTSITQANACAVASIDAPCSRLKPQSSGLLGDCQSSDWAHSSERPTRHTSRLSLHPRAVDKAAMIALPLARGSPPAAARRSRSADRWAEVKKTPRAGARGVFSVLRGGGSGGMKDSPDSSCHRHPLWSIVLQNQVKLVHLPYLPASSGNALNSGFPGLGRLTMAYSLELTAFFALMIAQPLGAAFAYLYPRHRESPDR